MKKATILWTIPFLMVLASCQKEPLPKIKLTIGPITPIVQPVTLPKGGSTLLVK